MKTKLIILLVISFLVKLNQIVAQTQIIIYTPRGSSVTAHQRPETMSYQDKLDWSTWVALYYPQATEINAPSATTTYNCHSYAWNKSEGGPTCAVAYYADATNESIYWTDYSYIETTEPYASKISYTSDDHSAIQTSTQGVYISKWGDLPLMRHARDYGIYNMSSRKYYRLNPGIYGTETPLCVNQERTFTSNTTISGSTYTWTKDNSLLDPVSGAGTTSYTVKAKSGAGNAYLQLQITTPSGEVATTSGFNVWVGKPLLYSVTGPNEGYSYTTYTFYANPRRENRSQADYTWILNPLFNNDVRPYYDYTDIAFYDSYCCYQVLARAENSCGITDWALTNISISDGYSFIISPNPASESVTVTKKNSSFAGAASSQEILTTNYSIRIFDLYGVLHYSATKSGNSFTFPITNLKDGSYFVQISDGKKISNLQLVIKH